MARFGSDPAYITTNLSATVDSVGNAVVSSNNDFGGSPLGPAARAQALYGIPNPNFNLLPPDPGTVITADNALPYWDVSIGGTTISAQTVYDSTSQTWGVRITPGSASSGDFLSLTTRSYLLNDSNLALRQKAYATLTRNGTNASNTWNLVLSATYYDLAGTQLSTYAVGTVADNGTATSISGITTSGSAAISASAAYVDFALTLTAASAVTGTATVDIDSLLIATSQPTTGSFLITQTFTSSGTWTRPTGVSYVDVVAVGAGGGGARGGIATRRGISTGDGQADGGGGGGSGRWALLRNIYVGDVASVSVGVGAGGAGVAGTTVTKAAAVSTTYIVSQGTATAGGATTFGAYLSVPGGSAAITTSGGSAGGTSTALVYGIAETAGAAGGASAGGPGAGTASAISAFTYGAPYTVLVTSGTATNGGSATRTNGTNFTTSDGGIGGTALGLSGSGAGGSRVTIGSGTVYTTAVAGGSAASGGGGGGGGAAGVFANTSATITVTGGAGGNADANTGGGGGGGGAAHFKADPSTAYDGSTLTLTSGAGGTGAAGFVTVAWTA